MAATGQEGCLQVMARATGLQGRCMKQGLQACRLADQRMTGLCSRMPTLLQQLGVHHLITSHCRLSWRTALNILSQSCRFWIMSKSLLHWARLGLTPTVERHSWGGLCLATEHA